ncbi:unnamed protein product [Rodentolepis nana]|uniref:SH3 domain-containing protein n=1 Tax=Rodentolepis nana TaxID=102285 RepID=A0A0R3T5E1_RODNA|nr:unnamed protein product [Rodentolepis nana]
MLIDFFWNHILSFSTPIAPLNRAASSNPEIKKVPQRPTTPFDPETRINFPHAIVIADFCPQQEYELGAKKGTVIGLTECRDDSWYYAYTFDLKQVGYIPRNFLKGMKLCEDADLFLLVTKTFRPQSHVDIGARAGDIMLCLDSKVNYGDPIPNKWIYCMNLSGRQGVFPGSGLEILDSRSKINDLLLKAPHAIAKTSISNPADGYVQISLGEALYIEKQVGDSVFGRTASGKVGKLALNDCNVIVPP